MGENGGEERQQRPKSLTLLKLFTPTMGSPRPSITLPPMESLFNCGSLAGAGYGSNGTQAAIPANSDGQPVLSSSEAASNTGFKQSRLPGSPLGASPAFTIPPGLSPACLLGSSEATAYVQVEDITLLMRASTDPRAVTTTYEGNHNHDVPAGRNSSHSTANHGASQLRPPKSGTEKQTSHSGNDDLRPIASLRLKEEHMTRSSPSSKG